MMTVKKILINEDNEGRRIDNFLISIFSTVPKSKIYNIIRKGEVRVNSSRKKPNYKLKLNSELSLPWKDDNVEDHDQGWQNGFIAQEVKAALDAESIPAEKVELWSEDADNGGLQSLGEAALIPMLVKALQEADDKIDALTARIETLEG